MKKILFIFLFLLVAGISVAKKVKFAVDMTGQVLNVTGVHIGGDFQTLAGFAGGDWMPGTTPMTQETGDTNIYSIVVDIPAFTKYEYKVINGDQWYEAEFVPLESRVGYNFNDNRWLWVDSLSNDTTFVGALLFSGNAPAGLKLLRVVVDMQNEPSVSMAGVHVAGDFQGWDPAKTMLYSFVNSIFEIIAYDTAGTYQFKYYNGNTAGDAENVPSACANAGSRQIALNMDTVLSVICFSGCSYCHTAGIDGIDKGLSVQLYPNPIENYSILEWDKAPGACTVSIYDPSGRLVRNYAPVTEDRLKIERGDLGAGLYFVTLSDVANFTTTRKLIVE